MKTILIVDDVESVRFFHKLLLTQAGFETLTANDGAEALAVLQRQHVDLVMLDLLMPRMSGSEFVEQARKLGGNSSLPVLVVSSESTTQSAHLMPTGARCEYLQKPILPESLLSAVGRLLGTLGS